jgi:hypothetical protein
VAEFRHWPHVWPPVYPPFVQCNNHLFGRLLYILTLSQGAARLRGYHCCHPQHGQVLSTCVRLTVRSPYGVACAVVCAVALCGRLCVRVCGRLVRSPCAVALCGRLVRSPCAVALCGRLVRSPVRSSYGVACAVAFCGRLCGRLCTRLSILIRSTCAPICMNHLFIQVLPAYMSSLLSMTT